MKKTQITLFLFFCGLTLSAQNVSDMPANSFPFNMTGNTVKAFDDRYEGVKGTYTFLEQFEQGKILLKKNQYGGVLLNYDAINDNVLVKKDTGTEPFVMRKDMIENFTLQKNDQAYHFVRLPWNGTQAYFLQLVTGKVTLYCKVSKLLQRADYQGGYNTSNKRSDEFVTINTYYLQKDGGELKEIQKSKKNILKALPEKEKEISALLKGNKLDFDDYTQMTLLFNDINGLY